MIKPEDIVITTYSDKPVSQWLYRPEVGIRITHIPTGEVASCHKYRLPHKNKHAALEELNKILKKRYK